jgi:hypothetical protein
VGTGKAHVQRTPPYLLERETGFAYTPIYKSPVATVIAAMRKVLVPGLFDPSVGPYLSLTPHLFFSVILRFELKASLLLGRLFHLSHSSSLFYVLGIFSDKVS